MLRLARCAMAQLARQGCISAQLEVYFSTMALSFVLGLEAIIAVVNFIRGSILPSLFLRHLVKIWFAVGLGIGHGSG